jgi:WD40-like Beta Propeller Repeat
VGRRDLFILGAVVLVAGFAVADAIRSEGSSGPTLATETDRSRTTTDSVVPEPDEDLGQTRQPAVPGAPGTIVLTEAGDCPVREFQVSSGTEIPNLVRSSHCELWAAPVTAQIAVGIAAPRNDAVPFIFRDLGHGNRALGNSEALFGFLTWSLDGQRAAWCNARRVGIDLELGGERRRLPQCPAAYTTDGQVAFAVDNRVVAGGRTLIAASSGITHVRFGNDGSIAVVVEGRRIERYLPDGTLQGEAELEGRLEGRIPVFSPNTCAAVVRDGDTVRLIDLGCSGLRSRRLPGFAGAWSPDGRWLAVSGPGGITFYDLFGGDELVRWPITAVQLAWRR